MTYFVSKLQFKHYEKGEFSAEQKRTLPQTLNLLNEFPWAEQRHFTSIQETGPSITILNNRSEYIKIGLYFSGKYCVYYRDKHARVSKSYADDLTQITQVITAFFEDRLITGSFEKDILGWVSKYHFATKYFTYTVKPSKVFMLSLFYIVWSTVFALFLFSLYTDERFSQQIIMPLVFVGSFFLLSLFSLCKIAGTYLRYKNCFLKVSKASLTFTYFDGISKKTYAKSDIENIITYKPSNSRSPNSFYVFIISLHNGDKIKFNNMMISSISVTTKFPDAKFIDGKGSSFWKL